MNEYSRIVIEQYCMEHNPNLKAALQDLSDFLFI